MCQVLWFFFKKHIYTKRDLYNINNVLFLTKYFERQHQHSQGFLINGFTSIIAEMYKVWIRSKFFRKKPLSPNENITSGAFHSASKALWLKLFDPLKGKGSERALIFLALSNTQMMGLFAILKILFKLH